MKRYLKVVVLVFALLLMAPIVMGNSSCWDDKSIDDEREMVNDQQNVYNAKQPPPFFEWSLPRDLWSQFYVSANNAASTWSYIQPITGGKPLFETPSMGYPIPFDTQITNPSRGDGSVTVDQAEPNGLYTSKNTDSTVIMAVNPDGTLSPIYTEQKVTAFTFPVRWEEDHWVRDEGEPSVKLTPNRENPNGE